MKRELCFVLACLVTVRSYTLLEKEPFLTDPKHVPIEPTVVPISTQPEITNTTNFDCLDVLKNNPIAKSGLYIIGKPGEYSMSVYCDMDEDGGGWTVFQRRNRSLNNVNFSCNWTEYEVGFGDLEGEFWLGNKNIFHLANPTSTSNLSITLEQDYPAGTYDKKIYTFGGFYLVDSVNYTLSEQLNTTTYPVGVSSGLHHHAGYSFSTHDRPGTYGWYDLNRTTCSKHYGDFGGWWYHNCFYVQLNAAHKIPPIKFSMPLAGQAGIRWHNRYPDSNSPEYTLATTVMKMRRSN